MSNTELLREESKGFGALARGFAGSDEQIEAAKEIFRLRTELADVDETLSHENWTIDNRAARVESLIAQRDSYEQHLAEANAARERAEALIAKWRIPLQVCGKLNQLGNLARQGCADELEQALASGVDRAAIEAANSATCPDCGGAMTTDGQVYHCMNCGRHSGQI